MLDFDQISIIVVFFIMILIVVVGCAIMVFAPVSDKSIKKIIDKYGKPSSNKKMADSWLSFIKRGWSFSNNIIMLRRLALLFLNLLILLCESILGSVFCGGVLLSMGQVLLSSKKSATHPKALNLQGAGPRWLILVALVDTR